MSAINRTLWALSLLLAMACSKKETGSTPEPMQNVAEQLEAEGDFSLYLEALEQAALLTELQAENITLLAPDDSAMSKFLYDRGLNGLSEMKLLMGETNFRQFWQYSLINARIRAYDFENSYLPTAALNRKGENVYLYSHRQGYHISFNGQVASISEADIEAPNGIIHRLDAVLSPATLRTLVLANPQFSNLMTCINYPGINLNVILNQENQSYTLLAPTNDAYAEFFGNNNMGLVSLQSFYYHFGVDGLSDIMSYHLLSGHITAESFSNRQYSTLYGGAKLTIEKDGATIKVIDSQQREASLQLTNISAVNGTLHSLNRVLLPY